MQRLRSLLFTASFALWTATFAPALLFIWLLGSPERWVRACSRVWARGVIFALKWVVGLSYVERGRENVPSGRYLVVANHQSTFETIASLVLFRDVAIVTKQELLSVPIFGWFLRHSPMILIDRESGSKAIRKMIEEGLAALSKGRPVLIFPEGTRAAPGAPVEFKRGVELLYAKLDCPVLPVAVNSGEFWGLGKQNRRAGTMTVSFLPAIPAGMPPQAAMKSAEQAIQSELDRIGRVAKPIEASHRAHA